MAKPITLHQALQWGFIDAALALMQQRPTIQELVSFGPLSVMYCRSIGDADMKGGGVIAEPEVTHVDLQPEDAFLVLATDGLWDVLSNQAVVNLVHDTVKEPTMCAKRLVTEAITQGSGKNRPVMWFSKRMRRSIIQLSNLKLTCLAGSPGLSSCNINPCIITQS